MGSSTYWLPTYTFPVDSLRITAAFFCGMGTTSESSWAVGDHLLKVCKSSWLTTYQILRAASHRAPSFLAASFSAKGTFKLNLILLAPLQTHRPLPRSCHQRCSEWFALHHSQRTSAHR